MIILYLVIIFTLLVLLNWIRVLRECRRTNISGPTPLPLLGSAHLFLVKPSEFLNLIDKFRLTYGDIVRAHIFFSPFVLMSHPKYVEPVMSSMEHITKGKSYSYLTCWLGQGLLTSTGQRWKTHRKFLTPAFHFNILQNFLPVFCKNQRIFTEKLRKLADGRSIDIFPLVALAALDNVTAIYQLSRTILIERGSRYASLFDSKELKESEQSIMGVCVEAQKHSESEYVKSIEELSTIISIRMQIPILGDDMIFNLLPYKKKQDKALKILHDQTYKVIKARSEELKKNNITKLDDSNDVGMRNTHAFLDLLLLTEIDGVKVDPESVREEVDTFMFEGHDTTTSGIVYTLYCLSKRRDVQEKIYEELKTIFGADMSRDPTYQELHQMKYLELVIKESMRLYPPVPIIERLITNECQIENITLPKGTTVVIDIFHMQRHPELYDDPLEFRPERFEKPLKNPFNWIAFSAGPRNCIGQKFAMMELKVTISEIVKNFIILPCDVVPDLCPVLILRSTTGVHIKLTPRY